MVKTILTGIQPNNKLHLGNYLGAIKPTVKLSKNLNIGDQLFLFVPDLHSLTQSLDYQQLPVYITDLVKTCLAAGINLENKNIHIYRQSKILEHAQIAWLLSCFIYFGELSRMTQFKDKSQKSENINLGLFSYPILMAGDILLYNAQYIPVGDDQKQHLELVRDLAIRINNKFNQEIFKIPMEWKKQLEFSLLQEGVRIRSLSNPDNKMSKSIEDPSGTILLDDDPKIAAKKIMRAQTDNFESIDWNWQKQPGITNLLQILIQLSGENQNNVISRWKGNTRYGDLKSAVAMEVEKLLTDLQNKKQEITDQHVNEVLITGEKTAGLVAKNTLQRFQKVIGLE